MKNKMLKCKTGTRMTESGNEGTESYGVVVADFKMWGQNIKAGKCRANVGELGC